MRPRRTPLTDALLAALPSTAQAGFAALDGLESRLERLVDEAAQAWPRLQRDDVAFVAHLARRLPRGTPDALLASLHAADLYLAFACAKADAAAIAEFEVHVLPKASAVLDRFDRSPVDPADARQQLRQKLFVATEGGAAGTISEYAGFGSLTNWTRAIAVRLGSRLERRAPPSVATDPEQLLQLEAASFDYELQQVSAEYRAPLSEAFREAFATLSSRERNVLRLHFIDRLNIDQIGAMHQVHRATVARWIQTARRRLGDETRGGVAKRCRLTQSDLEHVIGLLQSQLSSSLGRMLREPAK